MQTNKKYYNEIIEEKMGIGFNHKIELIKQEQCSICAKKNKNNCRLEMDESICKNYRKKEI